MSSNSEIGLRFTVHAEHESEVAKLYSEAGFRPLRVERKENGDVVFVLPKVADDQMYRLITAVPAHYSVNQAYVVGSKPSK